MQLDDDDNGGEGEPVHDDGPEWDSVEAERDYWKALALTYGAKLGALQATMAATWTVEHAADGSWITRADGQAADRLPLAGLEEVDAQLKDGGVTWGNVHGNKCFNTIAEYAAWENEHRTMYRWDEDSDNWLPSDKK